ncbi:ribonuclease P protein component [Novipirellula caenicola]|uniref:ribonuclease P protein component n=1 Tax=Novipirellula caenicola TaxID=1536901 RepID=UPI0031EB59B9
MRPSWQISVRYRFPKSRRILHSSQFTVILRRGVCVADGVLVLFAVESEPGSPSRLGVTIPKRTGNAVARNHWKRLIRESFRTQQDRVPDGMNLVVRPKKGATADWAKIQKSIPYLTRKAARRLGSEK